MREVQKEASVDIRLKVLLGRDWRDCGEALEADDRGAPDGFSACYAGLSTCDQLKSFGGRADGPQASTLHCGAAVHDGVPRRTRPVSTTVTTTLRNNRLASRRHALRPLHRHG